MQTVIAWLCIALFSSGLFAQDSLKYWVVFTDKNDNGYSYMAPEAFLSPRSIARRAKQQIPTTLQDEPVTPAYIAALRQLDCRVLHTSRWFNAATIATNDTAIIHQINGFPFVRQTAPVVKLALGGDLELTYTSYLPATGKRWYDYGEGFNQIQQLNGDLLHNEGYRGKGMLIAVLDAGFPAVDVLSGFEKLRSENRILATRDFVAPGTSVYEDHPHGTLVLGTMAGYLPGIMIGTAPEASYLLLRTEDASTEMTIEEANWVAAAEFADSMGADILNTSLGYTTFDDSSMSYTTADMDGNTALITRAADVAAQKGMLVVNSAGNSGNDPWQYISAPADGDSVFTIGAVTAEGAYAGFSSTGPTADGRLKPNVVAQGQQAASLSFADGEVIRASGTSFSSPILAGLAACLWQAHPDKSAWEIKTAIEMAGSQAEQPDNWLGYGLPNFMLAHTQLQTGAGADSSTALVALPNPFSQTFQLLISVDYEGIGTLQLIGTDGRLIDEQLVTLRKDSPYLLTYQPSYSLPQGQYYCLLQYGEQRDVLSIIKVNP